MADSDVLVNDTSADVVGVFDNENFNQCFVDARPIRANIRETTRTMEHPVENGVMIPDHRIINAVEIELSLAISAPFYETAFIEMHALYNAAELLLVQTRARIYDNMYIADIPHTEDSEMYDMVIVGLRLRELLIADSESIYAPVAQVPKDANLPSNVKTGVVQTQTIVPGGGGDGFRGNGATGDYSSPGGGATGDYSTKGGGATGDYSSPPAPYVPGGNDANLQNVAWG